MTLLKVHDEPDPVAVVRAWCNAAGPAMARAAFPVGFESGRLEVAVPDRAWLWELESRREELIRRLRSEKRMDQLREIAFVLGPTPGRQEPMAPPPACES
ncbi:MAG: DciA family protein, partial [Acidobacteria bacterium]|nr:DciA family protein [Acidobacteriota bacterium]